jgi:outer membrane lipoprotein-sorting protein
MEEKTKNWALFVGLLLIAVIVSAGCIGEKAPEEGEVSPTGEATAPTAPQSAQLSNLLGKVESIPSVKYDRVKTLSDGNEYTSKMVWEKGNKMRCQLVVKGEASDIYILDSDEEVAYHYVPETNRAREVDFYLARSMAGEPITESVRTFIELYEEAAMPSTEIETIDGKVCTVLGMSVPGGVAEKKMWIWQEYGLPIREELTIPSGTSRTEMKHIKLDPIPDSMFEVPAGAEMVG